MSLGKLPALITGQGRWVWPVTIALAVFIVVLSWPGSLIPGSQVQLDEIHSGRLTDWSPPVMAVVWRAIGATPQSMLVLDALLHWAGIALLAGQLRREAGDRWALAMVAAGLSPLSVHYLGVIQKDSLMVALFVLAAGLAARFGRAAAVAPAFLAMLTRANAVFAGPPLLVPTRRLAPAILLGLAISLALVPVSAVINRSILGARPSHVEKSLQLFDIAGTEGGAFQRCYQPFEWDSLQLDCAAFDRTPDDLTRPWLRAIARHPLAYAAHRLSYFNHAIFFLVPPRQECVYVPNLEANCSVPQAHPLLKDALARNPLVWPVTWLVAGLVLLLLPLQPLARSLALSGTVYGLAYLVVGVATGIWYFYWTELAVQLALVWQLARGLPRWRLVALSILATWIAGYAWRYLPLINSAS